MSGYNGYKKSDNARRKSNNTGEEVNTVGVHKNVKEYSPSGQGSFKEQAERVALESKVRSKRMPVKVYSEEEKLALQSQLSPTVSKPVPTKRPITFMNEEQGEAWKKKFSPVEEEIPMSANESYPYPERRKETELNTLVGEFFRDANGEIWSLESHCAQPTATFVKVGSGERKSGAVGSELLKEFNHIYDRETQEALSFALMQIKLAEDGI